MDKRTKIIATSLLFVLVILLVIYYVLTRSLPTPSSVNEVLTSSTPTAEVSSSATPTATPVARKTIKTTSDYGGRTRTYSVSYPSDWEASTLDYDKRMIVLKHAYDGQMYQMSFAMGSRGPLGTSSETSQVTYAGELFTRTLSLVDDKVVELTYAPVNYLSVPFEVVNVRPIASDPNVLPEFNRAYIADFDDVMKSLVITE